MQHRTCTSTYYTAIDRPSQNDVSYILFLILFNTSQLAVSKREQMAYWHIKHDMLWLLLLWVASYSTLFDTLIDDGINQQQLNININRPTYFLSHFFLLYLFILQESLWWMKYQLFRRFFRELLLIYSIIDKCIKWKYID